MRPYAYKFAARINSFLKETRSLGAALKNIAAVEGVDYVDLNYPSHVTAANVGEVRARLDDAGLRLNGLALRYYEYPEFARGAFTNHDPAVRARALDETRRGIDAVAELGGTVLTIWPSQDGFRYPLQADYSRMLDWEIEGFRAAADHNPTVAASFEYKPDDPRTFFFMNDIGTTLLLVREANHPNMGVTIDFCHSLYARENPAYALALASRYSRLLGVHLNDGYGFRDDGMPTGSVNVQLTMEFLYYAQRSGFDGVYYFDTFPDGEKAADELRFNVEATAKLLNLVSDGRFREKVSAAMATQDGIAASRASLGALIGDAGF